MSHNEFVVPKVVVERCVTKLQSKRKQHVQDPLERVIADLKNNQYSIQKAHKRKYSI